ncbi:isochorismatase family protein [Rhizobiales bacterium RZME27]|uniref:Isochorismatase family protein n=1 Tax=Endobacterium cereale TaxID=2663029 RepID=A0A6A8A4Q2_9HYPH|nr:isochorismatase family protein [Endobacterium cereale]
MTTALLIIDVQNAILSGLGAGDRQVVIDKALDDLCTRLGALKQSARAAGIPVILVQHDGSETHRLAKGSKGWKLRPEIAADEGDVVVSKRACDSFFETDLETRLQERGITGLVVGGCMTQFCVDTTVRRAVSIGYDVTLLADGHMTADMGDLSFEAIIDHHNMVLDDFDAGVHLVTVQSVADIRF